MDIRIAIVEDDADIRETRASQHSDCNVEEAIAGLIGLPVDSLE